MLLRWDKFTGPEARAFAERTQTWARGAPHGLPLLIAADHEGGPVFTQWRYGGTIFPGNMAAGAPALMPAHMVFPALGSSREPVSLSSAAMSGFLRGELKFSGLIVSDSLDMGAIANVRGSSSAAIAAFLAGNDVLLLGKADYP